jgi:uncharacterized membrane protein YfcA
MLPLLLTLCGFVIGGFGTMIGIGGGLFIAPALSLWQTGESADRIAALSLLVVFCNATSGAFAYARKGLVHYKSGLYFAAAAIPGAIGGTIVSGILPRTTFNIALGSFLILMAVFLAWKTLHKPPSDHHEGWTGPNTLQLHIGAGVSTGVGFLASILGIGGGIIHVPLLAYVLKFPVHRATATSHFVLAITSGVATVINIYDGRLDGNWNLAIPLIIGVVAGAQVGARVARHVRAKWIILALCAAILFVGAKLIARAYFAAPSSPQSATSSPTTPPTPIKPQALN